MSRVELLGNPELMYSEIGENLRGLCKGHAVKINTGPKAGSIFSMHRTLSAADEAAERLNSVVKGNNGYYAEVTETKKGEKYTIGHTVYRHDLDTTIHSDGVQGDGLYEE